MNFTSLPLSSLLPIHFHFMAARGKQSIFVLPFCSPPQEHQKMITKMGHIRKQLPYFNMGVYGELVLIDFYLHVADPGGGMPPPPWPVKNSLKNRWPPSEAVYISCFLPPPPLSEVCGSATVISHIQEIYLSKNTVTGFWCAFFPSSFSDVHALCCFGVMTSMFSKY